MQLEGPTSALVDTRFRGHDEVMGEASRLTGYKSGPVFPDISIAGGKWKSFSDPNKSENIFKTLRPNKRAPAPADALA